MHFNIPDLFVSTAIGINILSTHTGHTWNKKKISTHNPHPQPFSSTQNTPKPTVNLYNTNIYQYILQLLLWPNRKAGNPNLQVAVMHVWHVCSQHLFGLPLRLYRMHRTQSDHAHVTFSHMKLNTPSTALQQECFDLQ